MATKRKAKPVEDERVFVTTVRLPEPLWNEVRLLAMKRAMEERATRAPGTGRVRTDTSTIVRDALVAYLRGRK